MRIDHLPLSAISSSISCSLMPTIASPRSSDSSASSFASLIIGHRLDDGRRALRGVAGFEDAGADEHALRAELHHQRRVRGRRDAARGEVDHGQLAVLVHILHQLIRAPAAAWPSSNSSSSRHGSRCGGSRACIARIWRTACTTSPVPGSPLVRIMDAPSLMRRSASPRSLAPQTNGTSKSGLVDVVPVVRRGEHLALVDVVDLDGLQNLRLRKMADAALSP